MKNKVIIRSQVNKDYACELVSKLEMDHAEPKWVVTIQDYDTVRTLDQNSLLWLLAQHFADHWPHRGKGMNKNGWYYTFSMMFLDPISIIDFRTGEVKDVPQGMSRLPKKTFTWVIDKIYAFAREHDFPTPSPDELREYMR